MGGGFGRPPPFPGDQSEREGLRFISKHAKYALLDGQRRETTVVTERGPETLVTRWDDICQFDPILYGPPSIYERETAEKTMVFQGVAQEMDEVTPVSLQARIGVFDTEVAQQLRGWSDEQREWIEQKLIGSGDLGSQFILVEQARAPKPWPKYDELRAVGRRTVKDVAEKIAAMTQDLGIDPADVVAYERENANRPEVLEALAAVGVEVVEDEITVTA